MLVSGKPGTGKRLIASILHHFGDHEGIELETLDTGRRIERVASFSFLSPVERLPASEQVRLPGLPGGGGWVIGTRLALDEEESHARIDPKLRAFCTHHIELPSLAERIEDLDVIAMDVLRRLPTRRPIGGIADNALDCMRTYAWPSNIDEVAEVLTEAIEAGSSEQVELRDLPAKLRVRDLHQGSRSESPERQLCLEEAEKQAIRRALNYARGNKRKAARLLHIGKTTLYRKLKQYDLE